jgi:hypothetical protein
LNPNLYNSDEYYLQEFAYIKKYYSIIVREIYQYIKRNPTRHPDAFLEHSFQRRNLRYTQPQSTVQHHQFPMYGELARTVKIIQSNDSFKRNYIEYFG